MAEFISLSASGLPGGFDMERHSEEPLVTLKEKENAIEINYVFPGFTVGDNAQQIEEKTLHFKEVGISGAGFVSESGKPLLPSFGRFVQIPAGCDYEVVVKKSKPLRFDEFLVTPAQEQATDMDEGDDRFEYDVGAYEDETLYPAEVVQVGNPQYLDEYKVLVIHVRPLQYSAGKQQLVGYSNIKVGIRLSASEKGDMDPEEPTGLGPFINREGFGNLVLNPGRSITERVLVNPTISPIQIIPRGPEFIIIYDEKYKSAAERLADWKNHKGLITETVSIETVGNSEDKIKEYIRKRRRSFFSRLRYVLLFSDVKAITSEQFSEPLYGSPCPNSYLSDYYYYTSKDAADSTDCVLPWISGGRIPVDTLEEANTVVTQIINYERNPPCDPDYYHRMTFAAYFQDNGPQDGRADRAYMMTMEGIREHLVSIGFDVERVYVSNNSSPDTYKDGTAVPDDVKDAIVDDSDATQMLISETSEGQLAVGHRDHGSKEGWSHPPFTNNHLPSILSHYPSMFYSINCLTGRFDIVSSDSFAEDIMLLDGGAPSLIAATQCSGTWRNDSLIKGVFDALWPGVISTFPGSNASYSIKHNRLGDILNYAKSYLMVAHGTNSGVKHHFEIYHVVGDPTLQLWAEEPGMIRLRARIFRDTLHIYINPTPADLVITIWQKGKLLKRMAVSSGRISIPVKDLQLSATTSPLFQRYIHVCAFAPGHRYVQTKVRI